MKRFIVRTSAVCLGIIMSPTLTSAEETNFTSFRVLKPELAIEAAQAAMSDCRQKGYQIAVSVTDRFGILQVTLRDQLAGPHTPDTSFRKAWTAVSFRSDTSDLSKLTKSGEARAIRKCNWCLASWRRRADCSRRWRYGGCNWGFWSTIRFGR